MKRSTGIFLMLAAILWIGCSPSGEMPFVYPAQSEQQALISTDTVEGFFGQITTKDILLQLNLYEALIETEDGNIGDNTLWSSLKDEYISSLKESVLPWTDSDKSAITPLLKEAAQNLNQLNSALFSQTMYLVKTDGRHYGPNVWYTRQNAIVVPQNAIPRQQTSGLRPSDKQNAEPSVGMNARDFKRVIYHEVFHIISRYHPGLRQKLYESIGFYRPETPFNLPAPLDSVRLSNPDGIDFQYIFQFDRNTEGVPLIFASIPSGTGEKVTFFDALDFAFFRLDGLNVTFEEIDHESYPAFRQNIGTLTNYIIHPDEILADYFAFLMLSAFEQQIPWPENELNRKILNAIQGIIQNYEP